MASGLSSDSRRSLNGPSRRWSSRRDEILQTNAIREQLESQKAALEVEAAGLLARDRLLSQAIARDEREYTKLNGRLVEMRAELNQLAREAETARNTYATISGKATEAIVAEGMKSGFVRAVDRAAARPVARGAASKASLAAVLGLVSGAALALALVMEYLRSHPGSGFSPGWHPASRPRTAEGVGDLIRPSHRTTPARAARQIDPRCGGP